DLPGADRKRRGGTKTPGQVNRRRPHVCLFLRELRPSAFRPMSVTLHFPTYVYCEPLQKSGLNRFNDELVAECDQLRTFDEAGRKWSEKNYPSGYTSYASMNTLHRFSCTFEALERKLTKHVKAFAKTLDFDLRGANLHMTDCWVYMMP